MVLAGSGTCQGQCLISCRRLCGAYKIGDVLILGLERTFKNGAKPGAPLEVEVNQESWRVVFKR